MKLNRLIISVIFFLIFPPILGAQESPELQRCIWSCLAGSPGAASPEYTQCVQAQCASGDKQSNPEARWTTGRTHDLQGYFANIGATNSPREISYVCYSDGRSFFVLDIDLEGQGGTMAFVIDGRRFPLNFSRPDSILVAPITPNNRVLSELMSGSRLELLDTTGRTLSSFSLAGSSNAIGTVLRNCI